MNRSKVEFDPDQLAKKDKTVWFVSKTFHVDWSGWLEKAFKKLFKGEKNEQNNP